MSDTAHTLPDSGNPRQTGITLGGIYFRTKAAAERYIREILSRYRHNEPLNQKDHQFVMALLDLHPSKEAVIGTGVRRIQVEHLGDRYNSRRFVLWRTDSTPNDFTWRYALYPRTARQAVMKTCRMLIKYQIDRFRDEFFRSSIQVACVLSGRSLTRENCDVDHIEPGTFESLVDGWLRSCGVTADDVDLIPSGEYEQPSRMADEFLAQQWREYHLINARLRVIHRDAHQRLPKGRR